MQKEPLQHQLTTLAPMIRRFAYSLTGSMPDADDLLQNTLERILSRQPPEDVDLTKWAFRVCRNLWIDEYRSRKVRQAAAQQPELSENYTFDGERAVQSEMELERVNSAMAELPDAHRAVLSLVAVQGMSYKDVAETLNIPIGTVMSRLARARCTLVELLHAGTKRLSV